MVVSWLAAAGAIAAQTSSGGRDRVLTRVSNRTGVPVHRLSRQEAKTRLGFGGLEKANLLAKATGHSFRQVVSKFRSGEGWGKIAHDAGLNLGKLVSRANRSAKAAENSHSSHRQNARRNSATTHSKSALSHGISSRERASTVSHGRGHMGLANGFGHGGFSPALGAAMHGMGHGHGRGGR